MSRSRPASSPISYHPPTGQYYVTRRKKRIHLGPDRDEALQRYHRMALGVSPLTATPAATAAAAPEGQATMTAKELANRFIAAQQANWRAPQSTLRAYKDWLGRFLKDHPGLRAADLTVEMFAAWKVSLRQREYSTQSINHYLVAVRSMYAFAADLEMLAAAPKLKRVKNERMSPAGSREKPLYNIDQIRRLMANADPQLKLMILLGLNCGFGPKDMRDLSWRHFDQGQRVTLPRSKTGICQTFVLWPETQEAMQQLQEHRRKRIERMKKKGRDCSDGGWVFITLFWRPWNKDAVAEQFRRLCKRAGVPCYGFYRLRHCASTAMAMVTTPHVQRKFMRHSRLQQQVTYTHAPDSEVEAAIMKTRVSLLGGLRVISSQRKSQEQGGAA